MRRALLFLLATCTTTASAAFLACSGGDDVKLPDAAADAGGQKDTGVDCGPTNVATLHCREGAEGKACGSLDQPPVKVDPSMYCSMFKCGPGMVPVSMCGCNAEGSHVDAGDDCPGGSMDAATE